MKSSKGSFFFASSLSNKGCSTSMYFPRRSCSSFASCWTVLAWMACSHSTASLYQCSALTSVGWRLMASWMEFWKYLRAGCVSLKHLKKITPILQLAIASCKGWRSLAARRATCLKSSSASHSDSTSSTSSSSRALCIFAFPFLIRNSRSAWQLLMEVPSSNSVRSCFVSTSGYSSMPRSAACCVCWNSLADLTKSAACWCATPMKKCA
mmetsp:Transcript_9793/g.23282  ORF Transcript_9793/g.23282 Transcript_9793/m.23282 type:complete len:209 (+) Transcript_9793:796-1422(+)